MRGLINVLMVVSLTCLVLSMVGKYAFGIPTGQGMIAGIGPTGYLSAAMVLLLFSANLALLELLKKK